MGIDIRGWVEVKVDGIWTCVIEIDIRRNHDMFILLFWGGSGDNEEAIAGHRGTPSDHANNMSNEGMSCSWIGWNELENINWLEHEDYFTEDWQRLFELMDLYSQVPVVTDVRLIVSFF